jgi:Prealbumin-like fold domain
MTEVILGPTGGRRRRRLRLSLPLVALAALVLAIGAWAGPVSNAAGFEGDDGNLAPEAPINFDWNSFAPVTWTGTAPTRQATDSEAGWDFVGVEDFQNSTADSSFAGGTKQDNDCASVITQKPPGKDDLKRYYLAASTAANGDIFLALAWERIDQQGSPSAHVGFEFNQGSTACPAGSDGLVRRTEGDLLIVYDFEGGSATPTLTLREWVLTGACEVGSSSPPCWGPATDLTAGGFAEGRVNTGDVIDQIAPVPPETLAEGEFGEAIINLSDAGVFEPDECIAFGKTYAVSRSSGNSANAQMKDLVGPADININQCATVIIRKITDPASDPAAVQFGYTKTFPTDPATDPTFTLGHGEDEQFDGVLPGTGYTVVEDVIPAGWDFASLNCDASSGVTFSIVGATVTFAIDSAFDVLDCTYTNRARGQIDILKTDDAGAVLAGVRFDLFTDAAPTGPPRGPEDTPNGQFCVTDLTGVCSITNIVPGPYWVVEDVSTLPPGYDPAPDQNVVVVGGQTLSLTFVDPRQRGAIEITKTRKHAADGPGDHPHSGVTFTITGGELPAGGTTVVTNGSGQACLDGLVLSSFVGDYTVTETVPDGYVASPTSDVVSVVAESSCGDGNEAAAGPFHNTPLTNVTVSVDSQVPGGTSSTIDCVSGSAGPGDDISLTLPDLQPQTLSCTIVIDP